MKQAIELSSSEVTQILGEWVINRFGLEGSFNVEIRYQVTVNPVDRSGTLNSVTVMWKEND